MLSGVKKNMRHKFIAWLLSGFLCVAPIAAQKKKTGEYLYTVTVRVSRTGYTPTEIRVRKGQKTRLVFIRTDTQNCGEELVIAKYDIRRKLPLKQRVTVILTPTETGEFTFACGMNMMRGKIIVQ